MKLRIWLMVGLGALISAPVLGQTRAGDTPLHIAVRSGQVASVKHLLERGADANAKNQLGQTPLIVVAADGSRTPAARQARRTIARLLLGAGADVNAADREGATALHVALARERGELLGVLLDAGANVQAADARGRTPLHYAAQAGDAKAIDLLVGRGARIDAKDAAGDTPLHAAAMRARPAAVAALLRHKANVNAANRAGATPLHVLAQAPLRGPRAERVLVETARLLLAAGAAPDICAKDGSTPLDRARQAEHPTLAALLAREGGAQ